MTQPVCCPYCTYPIKTESVTLWDGRDYCRACVESVSPNLYSLVCAGEPMEDILTDEDVTLGNYWASAGKFCFAASFLVFGAIGLLLVLSAKATWIGLALFMAFIGALGAPLLAIRAAVDRSTVRAKLPRKVAVREGRLLVTFAEESFEFELRDCSWRFGSTLPDEATMFTTLRQGVVIATPEFPLACGFLPGAAERWRDFLTLARLERTHIPGCTFLLFASLSCMAGGLFVGVGLGYLMAALTNNARWIFILGACGFIQGPLVAAFYWKSADLAVSRTRHLHPASWAAIFFTLGFGCGAIASGFLAGLICGLLNAALGAALAWQSRAMVVAAVKDRVAGTRRVP